MPSSALTVRRIGAGVTYADGSEDNVLAILRAADDRSSGSPELGRHIIDWPTRYHFSYQRRHLLRPLRIGPGQRVLDVGAGSGALTRYIAEQGAEVVALEGNPSRAEAIAARCFGLDGVQVLCGALDDLDAAEQFDIVLLCGVLEYAGAPVGGAGGAPAMLARARSHLRDGGVVVVAIENQIGLKYLLGANEDHLGRPWVGIEGYSGTPGVRTWSRRELSTMLADAGLGHQHWLAPFPDYKLPTVVLDQRIYDEPDAPNLIDQIVLHPVVCFDQQPVRLSDSAAAHRVWLEAGHGLDVANSFLVVAGSSPDPVAALVPDDVLAWMFGGYRVPPWRRIRLLTTDRRLVTPDDDQPRRRQWLSQEPGGERPFYAGHTLGQQAFAAVRAHDIDGLAAVLRRWRDELHARAIDVVPSGTPEHPFVMADTVRALPDGYLDVSLSNFVETDDGLVLIDDEWRTGHPIDLRMAYHRALWVLAREIVTLGIEHPWGDLAPVEEIFGELAALAELKLDDAVIAAWKDAEAGLQQLVAGEPPERVREGWLDGSLRAVDLAPGGRVASGLRGDDVVHRAVAYVQQKERADELQRERDWLAEQRLEFMGQRDHLEGVVHALEQELERLRRPSGFVSDFVKRQLRRTP